jgi:diguanylate cyclase (GGDEF)-like protein
MVSQVLPQTASFPPERFVTDVSSELSAEIIQKRWQHVNVILRLSMLTGLPMPAEAALNLLCDLAAEVTVYDKAIAFFWDEGQEQAPFRILRGFDKSPVSGQEAAGGNLLNQWAIKYARPMLLTRGQATEIDGVLDPAGAASALIVPFFVGNRVRGSLQLFSAEENRFSQEDAQLLWVLSLVAENLLTREYASEGLLRFAFTDYLTGLRTRGYFEQQLELEFKRAERRQQKFALLMIDIDNFKNLNDTYGHHVGDQVLRGVASILVKDMREIDTVARYGGEEFVIILPETTQAGAIYVAERLRRRVEQAKFNAGLQRPIQHLTISIGIAVYDQDSRLKRELVEYSDAALYTAKREGRNRAICYSDTARRAKKRIS